MPLLFGDSTFLLLIPALIFALWAQGFVKGRYTKYSKIRSRSGKTGADVAKGILAVNGIHDVQIQHIAGKLTDNYDPVKKVLNLSDGIYSSSSIAALGIAAHEAGHAVQHASGYSPLALRNAIYPVSALGSNLAFPLFFIGLFFARSPFLMDLGIYLYLAALAFTVITLPVEFNASSRAVALLADTGYLQNDELTGAKKVLNAAAMTYVAAAAMAVMQLIRMLLLRGRRN